MPAHDFAMVYAQHVGVMQRRATEALAQGGFDHLVIPSGNLHYQVFDDRDYPYAVNPQFKAWAPLTLVDTVASFSFMTHFQAIARGVIDLRDIVYFGSLIALFLGVNAVLIDLKKAG